MKRLLLFLIFGGLTWAQGLVAVTGTFKYPNGTPVNGYVQISLLRASVQNLCTSPTRVVNFPGARANIVNGTLATLSLYATSCLSPGDPYTVKVFDNQNNLLYNGRWNVPFNQTGTGLTYVQGSAYTWASLGGTWQAPQGSGGGSVDVTMLDPR